MRPWSLTLVVCTSSVLFGADTAFDKNIRPVLGTTCVGCHNEQTASGGLNIEPFLAPASLTSNREGWEIILQKVRTGEMPPKGIPKPSATDIENLVKFVQGEFDTADRKIKPDPGRVTARRLNRNEYTNTIRDLLAVDFRAEKDFPTDESIQHLQFDIAIIQQNDRPVSNVVRQTSETDSDLFGRPDYRVRCQHDFLTLLELNSSILHLAYPNARTTQISQNPDEDAHLVRHFANPSYQRFRLLG